MPIIRYRRPIIRYRNIWNNFPSNRNKSIAICLIVWLLTAVGVWFLLPKLFNVEILSSIHIIQVVVLSLVHLAAMIYPMWEYWFKYHIRTMVADRYVWYIPVIISFIVGVSAFALVDTIMFAFGWITLIQIVGFAIVVFIPRLVLPPKH